jgi:hypothetical protein
VVKLRFPKLWSFYPEDSSFGIFLYAYLTKQNAKDTKDEDIKISAAFGVLQAYAFCACANN